jgi:single-stranded DNA-binding protein
MNYQKLILAGNATGDAERRTSKNGDVAYTSFQMGVSDAKDQTTYFKVAVFGDQGDAIAELITKGRLLLVEGRIKISNKGQVGIVADRIGLGPPNKETKKRRS